MKDITQELNRVADSIKTAGNENTTLSGLLHEAIDNYLYGVAGALVDTHIWKNVKVTGTIIAGRNSEGESMFIIFEGGEADLKPVIKGEFHIKIMEGRRVVSHRKVKLDVTPKKLVANLIYHEVIW